MSARVKRCLHCGHPKGAHRHTINWAVPPMHPARVTYRCVGDCPCQRHSDHDPTPKAAQ